MFKNLNNSSFDTTLLSIYIAIPFECNGILPILYTRYLCFLPNALAGSSRTMLNYSSDEATDCFVPHFNRNSTGFCIN